MDGFTDSTKTQYSRGGSSCGCKGGLKGAAKVAKVTSDFKRGAQPVKKAEGGLIRGAVARGNRMQAEEAGEAGVIDRRRAPAPIRRSGPPPRASGSVEPTSPLDQTLSTVPSKRGEMPRRGPSGAGFSVNPLITARGKSRA